MARELYSVEQILRKLQEAEVALAQGQTTAEVCRKIGATEKTLARWRKDYGGLSVEEAKERQRIRAVLPRLFDPPADRSGPDPG